MISAGSCAIVAQQGGDENFNPAPNVTRTFNISDAYRVYLPLVLR